MTPELFLTLGIILLAIFIAGGLLIMYSISRKDK